MQTQDEFFTTISQNISIGFTISIMQEVRVLLMLVDTVTYKTIKT